MQAVFGKHGQLVLFAGPTTLPFRCIMLSSRAFLLWRCDQVHENHMTEWRPQSRPFLGGVKTRDWAWFVALCMEAFGNGLVSSRCCPTVSA